MLLPVCLSAWLALNCLACSCPGVCRYVREPGLDQLPKQASPGDFLTGSVTYLRKLDKAFGNGTKPGGFPVTYVIADTKPRSGGGGGGGGGNGAAGGAGGAVGAEGKEESGLAAAVREAKVKYLKSLVGGSGEAFAEAYQAISADYPEALAVRQHLLAHLVQKKSKASKTLVETLRKAASVSESGAAPGVAEAAAALKAAVDEVLAAADGVIALVDEAAVAMILGRCLVPANRLVST